MKYDVISIHPYTGGCNLNCEFCYKKNKEHNLNNKPHEWWIELVKHCKTLAPQIAMGSNGEPFMDIPFVKAMSAECNKQGIILNVTTNGKLLEKLRDEDLKSALEGLTMVSISFDRFKRPSMGDMGEYHKLVNRIHKLTPIQVGCNLLIDKEMFRNDAVDFLKIVLWLFEIVKVDRVFALTPKNMTCPDILKNIGVYRTLTAKYKMFFVDDLCKMIMEEGSYTNWKHSCHYGKNLLSINENGVVQGCSFDSDGYQLDKPEDVLKEFKFEERFRCPYVR